jgi:hypothetical protein
MLITLVLGILSSLLAMVLAYVFRNSIIFFFTNIIIRVFPNISGEYDLLYEKGSPNYGLKTIINIKQITNILNGSLKEYDDDKLNINAKISGSITASRIIKLNFESFDKEHHNHGTLLMKLSPNSKSMIGMMSFICDTCEKIWAEKIELKKIS